MEVSKSEQQVKVFSTLDVVATGSGILKCCRILAVAASACSADACVEMTRDEEIGPGRFIFALFKKAVTGSIMKEKLLRRSWLWMKKVCGLLCVKNQNNKLTLPYSKTGLNDNDDMTTSIPEDDNLQVQNDDENQQRPVGYACSRDLIRVADKLPSNIGRAMLVHTLIHAYGLLPAQASDEDDETTHKNLIENKRRCKIIPVHPLRLDQMDQFHDRAFLKYLLELDNLDEDEIDDAIEGSDQSSDEEETTPEAFPHSHVLPQKTASTKTSIKANEKYGLEFDCPYFPGLGDYIKLVGGASVACADYLISHSTSATQQLAPVAINWTGGRHHAKKAACSGFCYTNDVVLCIQRLRTRFSRVLYLDIDLHHGDGVETAFARSSKVMCISVHRYEPGFYPGTGSLKDRGKGSNAIDYTLNIPTKRGLSGESLSIIMDQIIKPWKDQWFKPTAVVVTCGCDGLARDSQHREWNLGVDDYVKIVNQIVHGWNLPTVLLGGGGYHHADAARCWASLTAVALESGKRLGDEIPEHALMNEYATDAYQFRVEAHNNKLKDENEGEYLEGLVQTLSERLSNLQS